MRVIGNIPYLDKDLTIRSRELTMPQIREATGVHFIDGEFRLDLFTSAQAKATPGPADKPTVRNASTSTISDIPKLMRQRERMIEDLEAQSDSDSDSLYSLHECTECASDVATSAPATPASSDNEGGAPAGSSSAMCFGKALDRLVDQTAAHLILSTLRGCYLTAVTTGRRFCCGMMSQIPRLKCLCWRRRRWLARQCSSTERCSSCEVRHTGG